MMAHSLLMMPPPLPTAQDQPHCLVSPRTKYMATMRLARLPLLLLLLLSPRGAVANTDMDDVEAQVRSFYAKHNPEKVSMVPGILFRYKGREEQLLLDLQALYVDGPGPDERKRQQDEQFAQNRAERAQAAKDRALLEAASENEIGEAEDALERGASLSFADDGPGWNALMWAVSGGHEKMVKLLLEKPWSADPNFETAVSRETPLMVAAQFAQVTMAKLLLAAGAHPEHTSADGSSPLSVAAAEHDAHSPIFEVINAVLRNGREL
jgi:hypothetical protein